MTTEINKQSLQKIRQNYAKYSTKKLKKQQIYLNNDVVSDYEFITMVQCFGSNEYDRSALSEYYTNFPSDTMNKMLLVEYVLMTEIIFLANDVNFESILKKKSK